MRTAGFSPAVCLLLGLTVASSLPISTVTAAELIVGVTGPMSGPLSEAGKQYAAAVKYAMRAINKQGGLNGSLVKVVAADDKAIPKLAIKAARQLAAKKVSIVIGHYNSTPALAANKIYLSNNILVVSPQAIIAKLTELKAWNIVRLSPRADAQATAAIDFLTARSKKQKIALVHDNSAFARALTDKAAALLAQRGSKPALTGEIPPGTRHTLSIIRKLAGRIARSRIDSVYWTGSSTEAAQLLFALRKLKSSALLMATDVLAAPAFAKTKNPDALDGARMTLAPAITRTRAADDFLKKLNIEQTGENAAPAVAAYAAMQIIAEAARRAKTNNPRELAQFLRSGKTFQTITGPVSFDSKGDRREKLYTIYRWTKAPDGKLIFAKDKALFPPNQTD